MAIDFLTPPGRLVQGSCFDPQTTDAEGNALTIRTGPNAGKPRVDYFMALAIPKTDPGWPELNAKIQQVAREGFPNLFQPDGTCIQPLFAFKITDGDSMVPNSRGVVPNSREGYAGHWVLSFSGGFAPTCYTPGGKEVLSDPTSIKRGDYIRIYGSVASNESTQRPGIYLNHRMVERVGFGQEIIVGPSGDAVFGASAAALPAGASATPLASAATIAQPQPQQAQYNAPAPQQAQYNAPAPQQAQYNAPAPAPQQAPAPAPEFLNAPEPKFQTADGGWWTEAQLLSAGYPAAAIQALPRQ